MAQRGARLRQHRLQLRRTLHRIFLPTRMPCLFLPRHPRAVAEAAVAVVDGAVEEEAMQ
jgi:hypothetical protein